MRKSIQPCTAALATLLLLLAVPAFAQTLGTAGNAGEPEILNREEVPTEEVQLAIVGGQSDGGDGGTRTFRAFTDPPGFEGQVQWSVTTVNGDAEPVAGFGQELTIFFVARDLCNRLVVNALVETFNGVSATATLVQEDENCPDLFIPRGEDCWETEACETIASFCASPLPNDFFGTGSLQWKDRIPLRGSQGIGIDTVIERLDNLSFTGLGTRNTRIRLSTLDLEGCQEITVLYSDGSSKQWSVEVKQSDFGQNIGNMTVDRSFSQGGTFDSTFDVKAKYIFTDVDDPTNQVELDTGDPNNPQPVLLKTGTVAPWVSQLQNHIQIQACSTNFHPGVRGGAGGVRQCCKDVGHPGPGHLHVTGRKCEPCPDGGCKDTSNLTCRITFENLCTGPTEVWLGKGTDCRDSDGDGILDRFEKNDCCRTDPQTVCDALTDPGNPDTDGDGVNDGQEILNGTDPCDPSSF